MGWLGRRLDPVRGDAAGAGEARSGGLFVSYGEFWNSEYRFMLDPVSEAQARRLYDTGEDVVVAAGCEPLTEDSDEDEQWCDPNNPGAEWTLDITKYPKIGIHAAVSFYDVWGTERGSYHFAQSPFRDHSVVFDRLFLFQIVTYTYPEGGRYYRISEWVTKNESIFHPDGDNRLEEYRDAEGGGLEQRITEYTGYDTSAHWEPVPQFGEWAGLTRRDRFTSPLPHG